MAIAAPVFPAEEAFLNPGEGHQQGDAEGGGEETEDVRVKRHRP
jgi:hypothetical protein